jgi:small subunit ribosomal protein S6
MSKTKKTTLGHYEILFIVPNKFTEEEAQKIVTQVEDAIAKGSGIITKKEYWGKKKLAYEIKHNAYGYYTLVEFDMEKSAVLAVDQILKLSTDVLRHQIVSKQTKTEADLAKAAKIQKKIDDKKASEEKVIKKAEMKDEEIIKNAKKITLKEDKRSELKDLDEKLEGILSAKDLI